MWLGARDLGFAAEEAGGPEETRRGRRPPSGAAEFELAEEEEGAVVAEVLATVKVFVFGILVLERKGSNTATNEAERKKRKESRES